MIDTAKSQKLEKVRLWTSFFRYENLKIMPLVANELFNRNLLIVYPILFFNLVIAPVLSDPLLFPRMEIFFDC